MDQEFRNCKIWFSTVRDTNKWRDLKRALKEFNDADNKKIKQLKDGTIEQFLLCDDQNNPFYSANQPSKFTYDTLIKAYLKSKNFWQQNFIKNFNRQALVS